MTPSNGHNGDGFREGNGYFDRGTVDRGAFDRGAFDRGTVLTDDRSIGSLFQDLAQQARDLMTLELALAKTELSQKVSDTGKDVGFLAAGGFIAYAGFLAILAGIILVLANAMPTWLAALIVGVVVALVGYMLVRKGMNGLKGRSLTPQRTLNTLKEDKQAIQQGASAEHVAAGGTHDNV